MACQILMSKKTSKNFKIFFDKVTCFYCSPINNIKDQYQAILYSNGVCKIGYDVWRELTPYDISSHPVFYFMSEKELKKSYKIDEKSKRIEKRRIKKYVNTTHQ